MSELTKSSVFAALMLLVSVMIGIVGYITIEGYSPIDGLYMTMLIVSSVGFGEVSPLSSAGKIFTSIYMFLNLGILAYIVSVISRYMFEGEFRKILGLCGILWVIEFKFSGYKVNHVDKVG